MNLSRMQRKVHVANPQGLHMRPSAAFVELAGKFVSDVQVSHDGRTANGKSIWDLLSLGAELGVELTLEAEGPDAPAALEALADFLGRVPADA